MADEIGIKAYDFDRLPTTIEVPQCEHSYPNKQLITEYSDELCDQVIEHGREGNIIYGFCGKYNISTDAFIKWLNEKDNPAYAKFRDSVKTSVSAAISYYNKEIIHAIKNYATLGDSIPVLRGLLADIMKPVPRTLDELLFEDLRPPLTPEEIEAEKKRAEEAEKMARDKELHSAFRGSKD